jgi:arylsulfatase A-like enzyme
VPPRRFDVYKPEDVPLRPNVPRKYEKAVRMYLSGYYGLITSLDYNIGRLIRALDEVGVAEDTIFCFTSDHGDMLGSHGQVQKQRPWEESIHTPFIMRYPRKVKPRQKKDVLFSSVDIMPTLLGLCGLQVPQDVQGKDLSPIIRSETDTGPESAYFAITTHGAAGPGWDWRGVRTKEWKYAAAPLGDWVLYNLDKDPYEMRNLVNDSRYAGEKTKLKRLLMGWIDSTEDEFAIARG